MNKISRIKNPQEELRKILHNDLCDVTHEYYQIEGEFVESGISKFPNFEHELIPDYLCYTTYLEQFGETVNCLQYCDCKIDDKILEKYYKIHTQILRENRYSMNTIFVTKEPLSKCSKEYEDGQVTYTPTLISFADYDSKKHLSTIENKINNEEYFTKVEALDTLFIVENCDEKQSEALNKTCELFPKIAVDTERNIAKSFTMCNSPICSFN